MKTNYTKFEMQIVMLSTQDVVVTSGFLGGDHEFGNPNESSREESTTNFGE